MKQELIRKKLVGINRTKRKKINNLKKIIFILIIILGITLRVISISDTGLLGDELVDLHTLDSMRRCINPFSDRFQLIESDQMRLPFYTSIVLKQFFLDNILTDRYLSVLTSISSLILIYIIGKTFFCINTGLLAAFLLSVSTYDIGFSRIGLTTYSGIFNVFLLLSIFFWLKYVSNSKKKYIYYFFLSMGIAIASKLNGIIFLNLIIFITLFRKHYLTEHKKNYILGFVILIITIFGLSFYHLNLDAFLDIFNWFEKWNTDVFRLYTHSYDYMVILFFRLIFPLNILFFVILGVNVLKFFRGDNYLRFLRSGRNDKTRFLRSGRNDNLLLILCILYLVVISMLKFKLTWYLVPLFPIVYLILSNSIIRMQNAECRMQNAENIFILIIIIFSGFHLYTSYPYYELDGYQYSHRLVGFNKPVFLTFEGVKPLSKWLDKNINDETIGIYCMPIRKWNNYTMRHFKYYSDKKYVSLKYDDILKSDVVITSFYTKKIHDKLKKYKRLKIEKLYNDLDVFYVWKKN